MVVDLYQELVNRGLAEGKKPPKSILELCDSLEGGERRCAVQGAKRGTIYVCAMGTRAKLMAEEAKIRVDFTYGVIDKCILKALAGKSCLVLTSQGMMGQVQKRIEAYSQQSGEEINSVDLSSGSNGRSLPIDRDFVGTKSLK